MIVCLVTDRRRLLPTGAHPDALRCLVRQAQYAMDAGVDVLQIRERDLEAHDLFLLAREIVATTRGSRTRVVVNERLDVALAADADGVHLPATAMPVDRVRTIVPSGFLIGRSVHSVAEARQSSGADYLIAGTVWPTASKPALHDVLGVAGLTAIVKAARGPVLSIGGVTPDRAGEVALSGAAGIAGIGLFIEHGAAGCGAVPLDTIVADLRGRFDTPRSRS